MNEEEKKIERKNNITNMKIKERGRQTQWTAWTQRTMSEHQEYLMKKKRRIVHELKRDLSNNAFNYISLNESVGAAL